MQSIWWTWSLAGVQLDSRLTFGWGTTKEKIRKNSGLIAEIHLESARIHLESNQNMWRGVKSSSGVSKTYPKVYFQNRLEIYFLCRDSEL